MAHWRWFVRSVSRIAFVLFLAPLAARAQEASIAGTVVDATGGVLPGVTITALHQVTGNTFVAVTDGVGAFRISVRTGVYTVNAELSGFATATRRLELLVGQTADLRLQLAPSTVQETVTVTGEAPLVDTTSSEVRSSIDPRQMQDLPVNGRNWLDLSLLAAGARHNTASEVLGTTLFSGQVQISIDGLRVTQQIGASAAQALQPRYSRDAIAEFEVITNRFDATLGGATNAQVNAVTKSGTNVFAGTFSGYFRDDTLIAKDFVLNRVLPYSNQQLATTFGGPIRKDRIHIFGNFEFEREPQTIIFNSPFPAFNVDLKSTKIEKKTGGRGDVQFTPKSRLTVRGAWYNGAVPHESAGGATLHPSRALASRRHSTDVNGILTNVIGNSATNTLNVGYAGVFWNNYSDIPWVHPYGYGTGGPTIDLRAYGIGNPINYPQKPEQDLGAVRDDFSFAFVKGGRHDMKSGVEYRRGLYNVMACFQCGGRWNATGGPIPANIESLFPVWNNPATWNLAALSPITLFYEINTGSMTAHHWLSSFSGWAQDDWHLGSRLTLNLGARYELYVGGFADEVILPPIRLTKTPLDKNNIAPRLGFAYTLNQKTVIRGGYGVFHADPGDGFGFATRWFAQQAAVRVLNDGRPDFAANPFNGPLPTYEQALAQFCVTQRRPACIRRSFAALGQILGSDAVTPLSYQGSLGFQRQIGDTVGITADYTFSLSRNQVVAFPNLNLAFDPTTGANYAATDFTKRPYPDYDLVPVQRTVGKNDYHGFQTQITKRFSRRWQAQATYLLSGQWDYQIAPVAPGCRYAWTIAASGAPACDVPITLASDYRDERYLSGAQRHRATANAIWDAGRGFQVSGSYLVGDQGKVTPVSGIDVRNTGLVGGGRLRPNGTFIARNSFNLPAIQRLDVRLQQRVHVGRISLDGILEVFNVFNHRNLGTFVTNEASAVYGTPAPNQNFAFWPRVVQLGFRAAF